MPKKKYNTEEEKKQALLKNAKKYYDTHKDDPLFKQKRKEYYKGYYRELSKVKKEAYRTYNSEYSFYVRSVLTGKLEKRIVKNKQKVEEMNQKIFNMESKLNYMKNKFGHLKLSELNNDK